jgi:hypothetical protein
LQKSYELDLAAEQIGETIKATITRREPSPQTLEYPLQQGA